MNKLNTAVLGGKWLRLNDFEFLHNSNIQAFSGLIQLFGVKTRTFDWIVTGSNIQWGDGFFFDENEILAIESSLTAVVGGQIAYIALLKLDTGSELNKAGTPINAYLIRNCVIKYSTTPSLESDFLCLLSDSKKLAQSPAYLVGPWVNIVLVANYDANPYVKARKEGTGIVRLTGRLNKVSGGNVDISATPLPVDMRPAYDMSITAFALWGLPVSIKVQTNGHISVNIETDAVWDDPTGLLIHLDGITYNV